MIPLAEPVVENFSSRLLWRGTASLAVSAGSYLVGCSHRDLLICIGIARLAATDGSNLVRAKYLASPVVI